MEYSTVIYEKKDRIAKITLNRPDKLNALNSTLRKEFSAAIQDVAEDKSICVLITTGAGRAYSAGMDLKEAGGVLQGFKVSGGKQNLQHSLDNALPRLNFIELVRNLPIPTIAAINGFAITGGLELALAHDILIASETASFADTHARAGVIPGSMAQMLHRVISDTRARLASFTGNYIAAQEAYRLGMLAMVVPPEELMPTAEKIAGDILGCDLETVRRIKYLMNEDRIGLDRGLKLAKEEGMHQRWKLHARTREDVNKRRQAMIDRGRAQQ